MAQTREDSIVEILLNQPVPRDRVATVRISDHIEGERDPRSFTAVLVRDGFELRMRYEAATPQIGARMLEQGEFGLLAVPLEVGDECVQTQGGGRCR